MIPALCEFGIYDVYLWYPRNESHAEDKACGGTSGGPGAGGEVFGLWRWGSGRQAPNLGFGVAQAEVSGRARLKGVQLDELGLTLNSTFPVLGPTEDF